MSGRTIILFAAAVTALCALIIVLRNPDQWSVALAVVVPAILFGALAFRKPQ